MRIAVILLAAALILAGALLFFLSTRTTLQATPRVVSGDTEFPVTISNAHGIRVLRASLQQGTARSESTLTLPSTRFSFVGVNLPPKTYTTRVTAKPDAGFTSGPARLTFEAASNDFRGATDSLTLDVSIDLNPPRIVPDGLQHYINQGGAELVTFTLSGYWTESGVRVGKYTFRSFPKPGGAGPNDRMAFFAYPWDLPAGIAPEVYAVAAGGKPVTATFWFKLFPKAFRSRVIELTPKFLDKVVAELDPSGSGDPVPRFLRINGDMRRENNQALEKLRLSTEERVLWNPPFLQLSNSKVEAQFADVRDYTVNGQKVDRQVHLGFDLSVTANVPVVAANDGKVVHAGPLGIYGNCIVLDHGYALQSIYAHLSRVDVKPGDQVRKQQPLGLSGATGLAGGDHLHFSMQLDGVQINPVEWWDSHWLTDRILSKLTPTSPPAK